MITSGHVMIEDGVKAKEDYAPARKVQVQIAFSVPEGSEGQSNLDLAGAMANAKVNELLGKPAKQSATAAVVIAETATASTPSAQKEPAKEPARRGPKPKEEKTKAQMAEEAGLPTTDTVHKGTPPSQVDIEDNLNDILGEEPETPITDAELGKACQLKNGHMAKVQGDKWAPERLRKLVAQFNDNVAGKMLKDIPAAKRKQFLAELEALQ